MKMDRRRLLKAEPAYKGTLDVDSDLQYADPEKGIV